MDDKMREIFGDDSDSDQDEEVEEEGNEKSHESQSENEDDSAEMFNEKSDNNNEEQDEVEEEEEEEEEEAEVSHQEEVENSNSDNNNDDDDDDGDNINMNSKHKQKQKTLNSDDDDDDDENVKQSNQVVEAVFGDELADLSEDSDGENISANKTANITGELEQEEQEPEQVINVEIPKIKSNFGKEMHFVKLPNFLSFEAKPFNPETYEDETLDTDALDEEGKTRVKLKVENTIRWRPTKDENGQIVNESNARVVRWSDGSLSLHLGNEIFDVYKQYMQGDHNHLFVHRGPCLQGQAVFKTKLAFRPHSTDSLTHRKMTLSLVDSGSKTQKVKILTDVVKNPDAQRSEMIKKEEEKLREKSRRENQQRRQREKSHSKGISTAYLEDKNSDEDDSAISLSAIKSKFKSGGRNDRNSINSSGDESDRERRLNRAKHYDDDSDNERSVTKKKKKVVADDDE